MTSTFDAVPIGSVVFALIDPTPGHEIAFNHWYERDHFYTAGTAAPGVFAGARYIAPRWCRDLRRSTDDRVAGDPARGVHLALYFVMEGHDADRVAWATEQVALAGEQDRLFAEREHLHTWSYDVAWSWVSATDGVPPALALDRRYEGASVVLVDRADGVDAGSVAVTAAAAWTRRSDPVAVVLALRPSYEIMPSTWIGELDPDRRLALVCFHGGDVAAGWEASRARVDELVDAGLVEVVWGSPFVVSVFGTDRHVDER